MTSTIPRFQQAAVLENPGPDARIVLHHDMPVEAPGPGQILIKLSHSGIWYSPHALSAITVPR